LKDLKLKSTELSVSPAVSGNLQAIFKKCNQPADQDYFPEIDSFIFEMSIPGNGHEQIAEEKQDDGCHNNKS
jgi:hypothetical protein